MRALALPSDVEANLKRLIDDGADAETLIVELRRLGFGKVHSIKALVVLGVAPPGGAKELVHFSKAWADRKVADEAFHDELIAEFDADQGTPRNDGGR